MTALKVQKTESTGVVYASAAKPTLTVRFRSDSAPKSINGVSARNYTTEIICNDENDVVVGGVNGKDALSVRIRTSGALESHARLKALLTALALQCSDWTNEDVLVGFRPVTAPDLP